MGEDAAFQNRIELVFDESGQPSIAGFDVNEGEERVEMFLHHSAERGLFGTVALVSGPGLRARRMTALGAWAGGDTVRMDAFT